MLAMIVYEDEAGREEEELREDAESRQNPFDSSFEMRPTIHDDGPRDCANWAFYSSISVERCSAVEESSGHPHLA